MNNPSAAIPEPAPELRPAPSIRILGVGATGIHVLEQVGQLQDLSAFALDTEPSALATSPASNQLLLDTVPLRGLGTGGDPERGRALAEEHEAKLRALCQGSTVVFIVAGLGGGAGTGIAPVLAKIAKEAGALVLGFVTLPFDCEGNRRARLAQGGLEELKAAADGVVCLPNQRIFKLIDENTSVLDAFKLANNLLADGVRGLWRLLAKPGLIEIHLAEVCALLRDRHVESAFAVAEAQGPARSREVVEKLLAHPLLDGGEVLAESEAVLVSLSGGPDLTMTEVNRVMETINGECKNAQVIMGAAIEENYRDRLAVTLIAARKASEETEPAAPGPASAESLGSQLLPRSTGRPGSRFLPPPPALPPEQIERLMSRQGRGGSRGRKTPSKLRQGQLPLEIISKGRFDKSEPTIHKGEDLDVPTYIRRGVALN